MKIALIQLYSKPLSHAYNFDKASRHIESAAEQGAHLAILPEYALTSWYPASPEFPASCKAAESYLAEFQNLAKTLRIAIVPGTFIEELDDGKLANACYFISSNGEVISRYSKRNLWTTERGFLSPVNEPHYVFDTEFGKVGMLICWDLAFPEAARELVVKGARLIIAPTWWLLDDAGDRGTALNPLAEKFFLDSLVVCRAYENTCAVAFVNAAGPATADEQAVDREANGGVARRYAGLSQIGMPLLGPLGRMGSEERMRVVEVDQAVLDVADESYRVREDMERVDFPYRDHHKALW